MSWPGWAWTRGYILHTSHHCTVSTLVICHTFKWYLSTISSHFTQYYFIVFIAHAHTERQTSFNSATSHILHMLHNGGPSVQLRCDGVCSEEVIIVISIIISVSAAAGCQTANNETAKWRASYHHHHHHQTSGGGTLRSPQQAASSRVSRVGVTIVTIPWSPTPRGWAAGAGS